MNVITRSFVSLYCPRTKRVEKWRVDHVFECPVEHVQKALIRCVDHKAQEVIENIVPIQTIQSKDQ